MKKNYQSKRLQLLALALCSFGFSYAQVYDLGPDAQVMDISNTGTAVGNINGVVHFVWSEEGSMDIFAEGAPNGVSGNENISADGKFISASVVNPDTDLEETAILNTETNEWIYLGDLGQSSSGSASSSWAMSANGEHVAGMAWRNAAEVHSVLWNNIQDDVEIVDLGAANEGFNSRASAVNSDGTIVAGWQDGEAGMRLGAYWENGELNFLYDDEGNNLGEALAMTADGRTIVGYMNSGEGYIWNAENGILKFSHEDADLQTSISAISDDGKVAIGYSYNPMEGLLLGEGFIWTEETGKMNLNDYLESIEYDDANGTLFSVPTAISPDGQYIGGIGINYNEMETKGFVIKLPQDLSTQPVANKTDFVLYPNPAENTLHISTSSEIEKIEITNLIGQTLYTSTKADADQINVANLESGVYLMTITSNKGTTTKRFIKK